MKGRDAHTLRMLLVARSRLVSQRQATANTIRGLLKTFGLVVAPGSKGLFSVRVREQIASNPALIASHRITATISGIIERGPVCGRYEIPISIGSSARVDDVSA